MGDIFFATRNLFLCIGYQKARFLFSVLVWTGFDEVTTETPASGRAVYNFLNWNVLFRAESGKE